MRKVGSEAPAMRLQNASGGEQIVGMIHEKVQLLLLRADRALLDACQRAVGEHPKVLLVAVETATDTTQTIALSDPDGLFSQRYGIDQGGVVIDKEGIIRAITDRLDAPALLIDAALLAAKPRRGHDHENWMRA